MRLYAESINQVKQSLEPELEKINIDNNTLLKIVQYTLFEKLFSHLFSFTSFILTNARDKDGKKSWLNVSSQTSQFWTAFWMVDWLTIPADIFFALLLNSAANGESWIVAAESSVQAWSIGIAIVSFIASTFGITFNSVWQLILWNEDIDTLSTQTEDMFGTMGTAFIKYFENVWGNGFKPALLFTPIYALFAMSLPYSIFIWNVNSA